MVDSIVEWLNSEPQWGVRLGPNWIGTKHLGGAQESVTGLWTLSPPYQLPPHSLSQIVVKQLLEAGEDLPGSTMPSQGSSREIEAYELLNKVDTKHITSLPRWRETHYAEKNNGYFNFKYLKSTYILVSLIVW